MRIGSLFSGYGGLDLACESFFHATTAWHCEWDDAPSKILAHHWPDIPNYRDVTQIDWTTMPPVDILTGGYPCQPFSAAGQRKGADDERHLWPYVREAIRHLRPRYTVLENVAGHRSLGFDRVLGDLAEDGLDVWWTSLRASDVGAPHHRERLFILVANPAEQSGGIGNGDDVRPRWRSGFQQQNAGRSSATDDYSVGCRQGTGQSGAGQQEEPTDISGVAVLSDTQGECEGRLPERSGSALTRSDSGLVLLSDTERSGRRGGSTQLGRPSVDATGDSEGTSGIDWGAYGAAVRRWERVTRPAPAPTELNSNGRPRLNAAFAEWMMGLCVGWVTGVPGISRAHQLKAIGNGVCPPQAFAALGQLASMAQIEECVA